MAEKATTEGDTRFCARCGTRLQPSARFCSKCGHELGEGAPGAGARSLRDQMPGLAVLASFLVIGLVIWFTVLRPGEPTATAPRRSAPGPVPEGAAAGMPPGHPPLTLPPEAQEFIAQLTAKAEAAPNDASAWKNLAQVQLRASQIDPSYGAKAIESYRRALAVAPEDTETLRALGNTYYDQERYAAAVEQYERYLAKVPDDPNVRTDLGTAYLYQRQVDRAIEVYGEVIKAHPEFAQAHFNLALAYEAKGERAKALASLAVARSLTPDEESRARIDRVVSQLKGAPTPGAPGGAPAMGAAAPDGGGRPAAAAASAATDFQGAVEAALRNHQIIGPKVTDIEWPDATHARVVLSSFPVDAMPDFVRDLVRTRLEAILDEAKAKYGVSEPGTIELVDASRGAAVETVTH